VAACATAVNASAEYRAAGADWVHGAVTLLIRALPDRVEPEPLAIWLDLDRGACRDARLALAAAAPRIKTDAEEAAEAEWRYRQVLSARGRRA